MSILGPRCVVCHKEILDNNHMKLILHKVHDSTHESHLSSVTFHKNCSFTTAQQMLTDLIITCSNWL